jgi:hypothetical protein
MRKSKKIKTIKMNLTLTQDFYQLLKENAGTDYMKVATWTKQFLMKSLIDRHKPEEKILIENETKM